MKLPLVSLSELLVALAVVAIVLTGLVSALDQTQRAYTIGSARIESQQAARVALDRLAREIRQAGAGPPSPDVPAISVAEPTRVVLHFDLNGDGVIAGTGETVTWLLRGKVLRRDAGGGAQPIINGVRDFALSYLDEDGAPTTVPAAVRTVVMSLTTEPDHAVGDPSRRGAVTMSTAVRIRNR